MIELKKNLIFLYLEAIRLVKTVLLISHRISIEL